MFSFTINHCLSQILLLLCIKYYCSKSLEYASALMVYISILEQQAKFGDALEILSGKLGSLLLVEVDKLRIQVLSEASMLI